jgi:hypothetical protein
MFEWYDFTVYALFAGYIAGNFFPGGDSNTRLLKTFLVFGLGFVVRPLGAVLIGNFGDRAGRKAALTLTILAHDSHLDHAALRRIDLLAGLVCDAGGGSRVDRDSLPGASRIPRCGFRGDSRRLSHGDERTVAPQHFVVGQQHHGLDRRLSHQHSIENVAKWHGRTAIQHHAEHFKG